MVKENIRSNLSITHPQIITRVNGLLLGLLFWTIWARAPYGPGSHMGPDPIWVRGPLPGPI